MVIQEIRAFSRFYMNLIGALDYSRHLYAPFTLTEARVLYELAHAPDASNAPQVDAADLRVELSLDAGHLSRILARFDKQHLVTRAPSERDARRQRIALTEQGSEAASLLEERSRRAVRSLLGRVPEQDCPRLVDAMHTVREILGDAQVTGQGRVTLRGPRPGDLGWVLQRSAAVYAAEFGWNSEYESLVAGIVADFATADDQAGEALWIAERDGEPAGCALCLRGDEPDTARLRLLFVEPGARGHRIGERLLNACVAFTRNAGYRYLVLWTHDAPTAARKIYQRVGFELVAEAPQRSFGVQLVGQDWRLEL